MLLLLQHKQERGTGPIKAQKSRCLCPGGKTSAGKVSTANFCHWRLEAVGNYLKKKIAEERKEEGRREREREEGRKGKEK